MELLKNLEGLSADEQMTAVVELQKAAMKHLEEQKQASIGKSAELVIQGLKKIKSDFEAKFDSLNYDIQTKVASLKDGEQGLQGPKGDQGERGLDGANGRDGRDGKDGKDGVDGVDGVGVRDAKIDFDGSLVISLTDGREINCGEVVSVDVAKQIQKVTHNIQTGSGGDSQTVLDAIAALQATIATYGTMATQNANNVAITGGAINNTTIGATTPSTGVFTTLTATGQTSLGGAAGSEGLRVTTTASANRYLIAAGSNGGTPNLGASAGALVLYGGSGQGIAFYSNAYAQAQFNISHTASAVNYVQVTGAATNNNPTISAQGSDSSAGLIVAAKGYSGVEFQSGGRRQFLVSYATGNTEVNYNTAKGSNTGMGVQFQAAGSDTNISQVFQSKGTGAIDLAAGSSGVNISNGGTVTAITRTAGGSAYTSIPSLAISAPTTAGGVQATATVSLMTNVGGTVQSGGTGYTVNDVLTVVGGTGGPATLTVTAVSGGVITTVSANNFGQYSVLPTNPVSVTGGTGSGATFNLTYGIATSFTITNAGSGYVEQPTVTFSGGGGSGAAAYATVGSATTVRSLGSTVQFVTPAGIQAQISDSGSATPTAYPNLNGSTFNLAYVTAVGSAGNAGLVLASKGTSAVDIYTNSTGSRAASFSHTASAVNYVQVTGAATGGRPTISAQGSDTNINFNITAKGSASVYSQNGLGTAFEGYAYGNANYLSFNGTGAGVDPFITVKGSDTNIDLVLQPKGTGALQAQQTDSTATGGNARGANAVDWQTLRDTAAKVASGLGSVISGGRYNQTSGTDSVVAGGQGCIGSGSAGVIGGGYQSQNSAPNQGVVVGGYQNNLAGSWGVIGGGYTNSAQGAYNIVVGGYTNSGTASAAVTTQSATMNGTTAVTLAASNANIKVGQLITGTSINSFPATYVAAISGTSLTLSQAASGSSTSTLSFYTPHGVVVGGGNNQATGAYSFIGGGGDAGTAANRNVASGDWSVVCGGIKNVASGFGSVVVGGGGYTGSIIQNTSSGSSSFVGAGFGNSNTAFAGFIGAGYGNTVNSQYGVIVGGSFGSTRSIVGNNAFPAHNNPITQSAGVTQAALLVLAVQTTDATSTVLRSDSSAAGTTNQVILPNNSAYAFRGEIVSGVTGGGNSKSWTIEGLIKRGANAASTTLVGSTVTSMYADAGAVTWTIALSADTTNGGLAVTFTGQAATTIRTVAQIRTTEMTY